MASTSVSLPPNAPMILGPPIIGVTLNWWLYGIFLMQYFVYVNNSGTKDSKWLQGVVHFLFILDTAQTFMVMDDVFFWFVYNFGDLDKLFIFNVAAIDGPFLDAVITVTVQSVYCWRLWKIGGWKVLPVVAATLALVSAVGGMIAGVHSTIDPTNHDRPALYLWLIATAVTDIVLASSMAFLLLKYRGNRASQSTTMAIIKRILLLTLETNALTAAAAIALVTFFLAPSISPPNSNLFMVLGYTLGKMYSNCFMVLLNQRVYYESPGRKENDTFNSSSSQRSRGIMSRNQEFGVGSQSQTTGQISVIRFTETRTDEPSMLEMDDVRGPKDDFKPLPRAYM
ncbi:hypothetical protein NP233_g5290 [Leucocoprinus birnbaumii]|uniref:DUF6534 domain-containing protein n=1 Tax=Leucocoprinus birnbaumii TaxID=56174 RepID=A0AAD5VVR4_9AGAR|nr:hypothetical protein NP233_g5290 [Leucocoprinus birnbaumii]